MSTPNTPISGASPLYRMVKQPLCGRGMVMSKINKYDAPKGCIAVAYSKDSLCLPCAFFSRGRKKECLTNHPCCEARRRKDRKSVVFIRKNSLDCQGIARIIEAAIVAIKNAYEKEVDDGR